VNLCRFPRFPSSKTSSHVITRSRGGMEPASALSLVVLPAWDWLVCQNTRPDQYGEYIADSLADNCGIPAEATDVRHSASITREVRQ